MWENAEQMEDRWTIDTNGQPDRNKEIQSRKTTQPMCGSLFVCVCVRIKDAMY